MRLIDADALKERSIRVSTVKEHCYFKAVGTREIDKAPTVDAAEVVHGCNVYDHDSSFECSVCGWGDYDTLTADTAKYNYCPNCGAKMDGGEDNG